MPFMLTEERLLTENLKNKQCQQINAILLKFYSILMIYQITCKIFVIICVFYAHSNTLYSIIKIN